VVGFSKVSLDGDLIKISEKVKVIDEKEAVTVKTR